LGGHLCVRIPLTVGGIRTKYRSERLIPRSANLTSRCAFNCCMTMEFDAFPGLTTLRYPIKLAV
jgi:hypothetical protein